MILWTIIIALTVILDQITKIITIKCLDVGSSVVFIPGIINFTHIKNNGAAFGMLNEARWVFLLISAAAIIALPFLLYKYRRVHFLFGFSLSLIIGGAIREYCESEQVEADLNSISAYKTMNKMITGKLDEVIADHVKAKRADL